MNEENELTVADVVKAFLCEIFAFIVLLLIESLAVQALWNNFIVTIHQSIPSISFTHAIAIIAMLHLPVVTQVFY